MLPIRFKVQNIMRLDFQFQFSFCFVLFFDRPNVPILTTNNKFLQIIIFLVFVITLKRAKFWSFDFKSV